MLATTLLHNVALIHINKLKSLSQLQYAFNMGVACLSTPNEQRKVKFSCSPSE